MFQYFFLNFQLQLYVETLNKLNASLSTAIVRVTRMAILLNVKEALYRIWCGVNRLGYSGVNRLGDTSAFVNTAGQLLLTRQGKTGMDGVGIVFDLYTAPLQYLTRAGYAQKITRWVHNLWIDLPMILVNVSMMHVCCSDVFFITIVHIF